jgi:hypothetical protein
MNHTVFCVLNPFMINEEEYVSMLVNINSQDCQNMNIIAFKNY